MEPGSVDLQTGTTFNSNNNENNDTNYLTFGANDIFSMFACVHVQKTEAYTWNMTLQSQSTYKSGSLHEQPDILSLGAFSEFSTRPGRNTPEVALQMSVSFMHAVCCVVNGADSS
jgi:hypothetical protein